jgi:TetR/AcrR family transcriptional regulator
MLRERSDSPSRKQAKGRSSSRGRVPERRIGAENSKTRAVLLDAAEILMLEEGYAAVTSRRLAAKAGLKRQLVHYYFRTMDDLYLELWRRYVDKNLARQARALASPQPMRAMWEYSSDKKDTALGIEFMALARHRKAIRTELGRTGEWFRSMQSGALAQLLEDYGLKESVESPETLAVLIASVSRVLIMESGLGIVGGHSQVREWVERWLTRLEGPREQARRIATKPATADK